jgi:hypothetical protein
VGTLTAAPVKDVYQKLVWYDTSTKKLMYTNASDVDAEVDDAKISGDLTVTGGKVTFGNSEVIHNEADDAIYIQGQTLVFDANSHSHGIATVASMGQASNDSKFALYDGANIRWSMGQDQDDSAKLKFDYANTAVGGATKLTLDGSGNLTAAGDIIAGDDVAVAHAKKVALDGISGHTYISESADDIVRIVVGGTILMGLTEDTTSKVEVTDAHLEIDSGKHFYLDGGGDSYIFEHSADHVRLIVGGDDILRITEDGADGNTFHFKSCSAGFEQLEPTYHAADTNVDFRHSNKQFLTFGAGNIADLNLQFPSMSGNFTLLLKQDGTGSRTVAADGWLAFDSAGNAASGSSTVKFAGGNNPTLTTDANHVDIISFYWDNDNEIAYGVATLDFQF